jgi:hypothetical protein
MFHPLLASVEMIVSLLDLLRVGSITIDGEAVWCGRDGKSERPGRRRLLRILLRQNDLLTAVARVLSR